MRTRSGSRAVVARRSGHEPPGVNVDAVTAGQAEAPSGGTKVGGAITAGQGEPTREGYLQHIRLEAARTSASVSGKVGWGTARRGGGGARRRKRDTRWEARHSDTLNTDEASTRGRPPRGHIWRAIRLYTPTQQDGRERAMCPVAQLAWPILPRPLCLERAAVRKGRRTYERPRTGAAGICSRVSQITGTGSAFQGVGCGVVERGCSPDMMRCCGSDDG